MDATHDSITNTLAIGGGFLLFAGGFWIVVSLGHWALAPVERRDDRKSALTQFSLREVGLVAIELQLFVGALAWWCGETPVAVSVLAVVCCALLLAWWHGAQRLARCGVRCVYRRGLFLAVVVPLATASIAAALWHNGQAVMETCLGRYWSLTTWLAGNVVIIVAFSTCRLLTMWAMQDVTPPRPAQANKDGMQYVS